MDADGKNQIELTDGTETKADPDWSPDGSKIAFTVLDGLDHIEVIDANGQNRVRFQDQTKQPSWSPDGGQIAFVSRNDEGIEIYVMGADGQGLERLTHDLTGKSNPSFSPDGRRIAYDASHEGFRHIYVMGADGKNPVRLTHNKEDHSRPTWSPDGRTIAYVVSKDGIPFGRKIHLMTADGKYIKQLSKVRDATDDHPDFSPVGLAVSPSSKTTTIWGRLKKRATDLR
jgi:TolB protein